jgi:hypothetical protein
VRATLICLLVLGGLGVALSIHWWNELAMLDSRAAFCGLRPNCLPDPSQVLGAAAIAIVAFCLGIGLLDRVWEAGLGRLRMARATAGVLILSLASLSVSLFFWYEAHVPMTEERYAALCGNRPECYPEMGDMFFSLVTAALAIGLGTGFLIGWLIDIVRRDRAPSPRTDTPAPQ